MENQSKTVASVEHEKTGNFYSYQGHPIEW
jgi:hypothetical protein